MGVKAQEGYYVVSFIFFNRKKGKIERISNKQKKDSMEQQKRILISRNQRTLPRMANTTKRIQQKRSNNKKWIKETHKKEMVFEISQNLKNFFLLLLFSETYSFQQT